MKTKLLPARTTEECAVAVEAAVQLLRAGKTVALPTETVYGLAADATNADAVIQIFEAKQRPRFDPLIVHIGDRASLESVARIQAESRDLLNELMEAFWPGPLSFVLPRSSETIPDIVAAGLETVAVRMSAHPLLAAVLRQFGKPVAAPSANRFGRISPTRAEDIAEELGDKIPLIVDAGPTQYGLESTIIRVRDGTIDVLRQGPITVEQLELFARVKVSSGGSRVTAPGQLPSHYAPRTPVLLIDDATRFIAPAGSRSGLLAWQAEQNVESFSTIRRLSKTQDLREAATNLFRCLRELDAAGLDLIVAEKVPEEGIGAAIMDRLRRAAAGYSANSGARGKPG